MGRSMFGWMSYYGPGQLVAIYEKITGKPSSNCGSRNAFTVTKCFFRVTFDNDNKNKCGKLV